MFLHFVSGKIGFAVKSEEERVIQRNVVAFFELLATEYLRLI